MRLTRRLKSCLCILGLCLWGQFLFGQDLHFSMSPLVPISLNPALTAVDEWDIRFGAIWRDQWRSVPVPYSTFSAFYDQKYAQPVLGGFRIGWGLVFHHDQAGDGQLSWTNAGIRLSVSRPLNDEHTLSLGFGTDLGQRAVSPQFLQFGDQFNGEFFDPSSGSQENFFRSASPYGSLQTGLNWFFQPWRSRTKVWAGLAAQHLNQPTISFLDLQRVPLPVFYKAHLFGVVQTNSPWDVIGRTHYFLQGSYREWMIGGGAQYHLNFKGKELVLGAVAGYRYGDALLFSIEGRYQQWKWGINYDINTSPFQVATRSRGAIEMAVHYYILQVKPPDEFKSCPVF